MTIGGWRMGLLMIFSLLACLPVMDMAFYPEDMKALREDPKALYKDGYGSYATAMQLAALSQLRNQDTQAFSMVMAMSQSTITLMGQTKLMFVPDMEKVIEYMRHDSAFSCLRRVHSSILSTGEKAMSDIASNEKRSPSSRNDVRQFPNVAPNYLKRSSGYMGAVKMGLKTATFFYDAKSKPLVRFTQFTKPGRQWLGKGTRFLLGSRAGGAAAKVGVKVFAKVGVPLLDIVTFGLSLDTFIKGIKENNNRKIVGGTVGMVGSIVGMTFFLLCVFKGAAFAAVWGPIGLFIGFLFLFAGLAVSFLWPLSPEELHNTLMEQLRKITKASLEELGPMYNFLKSLKKNKFDDVYLANQAAMYYGDAESSSTRNKPLTFRENAGQYHLSFRDRDAKKSIPSSVRNKFFRNSTVLHNGYLREFVSPNGVREKLTFDFDGIKTPNSEYSGITVMIYRSMIDAALYNTRYIRRHFKGIDIDLSGDPETIGHHIVLDRYFDVTDGMNVKIRTGPGHDSLSLDGAIVDRDGRAVLDVDLGEGENTLSFMGTYRFHTGSTGASLVSRFTMLGFFFDAATGNVYYRDTNLQPQSMGTVKGVKIFVGSPRPDVIYLTSADGPDDYEEGDTTTSFDQNKMDHFTVVKMYGVKTFVVDLTQIPKTKRTEFTIIDSAIDDPDRRISRRMPGHYPFTPYIFICYDEDEGTTIRHLVYKEFTLYIYRDPEGNGNLKEMVRVYIKTPRWPEIRLISKQHRSFYTVWNNMIEYKHIRYDSGVDFYMFTPIHRMVFPVYLPQGKNITIDGLVTSGTSHNDFLRLSCRQTSSHQNNFKSGTWTVEMGAGTDYICIGRDFLDMCVIDYRGSGHAKQVLLMKIFSTSVEFYFEHESNDNPVRGKEGKLIIKRAEKIINEYGQVLVDLENHEYDEGEELNVVALYSVETRKRMGLREEEDDDEEAPCTGVACDAKQEAKRMEEEAENDAEIEEFVNNDSNNNADAYCRKLEGMTDDNGEPLLGTDWN